MKSIRRQLIVGLLAGLTAAIALSGLLLFAFLGKSLTAEYDAGLLAKARGLTALTEEESSGEIELDFADNQMPEFERAKEPEYFEIRLENGSVLERSRSLGTNQLPRIAGAIDSPLFRNLPLPDGRPGRAVGIAFICRNESDHDEHDELPSTSAGQQLTLVLARSRGDLNRTLHLLAFGLGAAGVVLPAAASLIVVLLVGRGLRPLDGMAARAASIDSGRLGLRFPETEMPAELRPICLRLNELLDRLEKAFDRERRFTGNAAHELRTPIAELRSLAEVASIHPDDSQLARTAIQEALAIAHQMERLVTVLLALARGEAGVERLDRERIDLADLVGKAWTPLKESAQLRSVTIDCDIPPHVSVESDRALLHAVLSNILSNAVAHSPEGTRISTRATDEKGVIRLRIANANSSLSQMDLPRLFEPFWRKDPSRTDNTHSGLGLAVVATLCRVLGIKVDAGLTGDNRVVLELLFEQSG